MNFWNLVMFAIKSTPERALAILRDLRPSEWKLYHDGEQIPNPDYSFALMDTIKNKMLVMNIAYDGDAGEQNVKVWTRLKNDGSDALYIDGESMTACDFEFHSKPLKKEFKVELGYNDETGEKRLYELRND